MRVPLSSRTLLLLELIIEPAVVELEATDDNVMPGMPTTPWLAVVYWERSSKSPSSAAKSLPTE